MRQTLLKLGYNVYGGENAPYLWVKTPQGTDSWKFFEQLLYGCGVVCTPGVGFGPSGEGYFRLTSFGDRADMEEAMHRMEKWVAG
jgi:LL-diaminopimelate aminotransferase